MGLTRVTKAETNLYIPYIPKGASLGPLPHNVRDVRFVELLSPHSQDLII